MDYSMTSEDLVPIYASISPLPGSGKTANVNGKMLIGPIQWEEPEGGYSSSGEPRWGPSQKGAVRAPAFHGEAPLRSAPNPPWD